MENEQQQAQVSTFLVDKGIALAIEDPEGKKVVILTPDDIGRVAMSLISNAVLFQFNEMLKEAAKKQEFERIRSQIDNPSIHIPGR